MLVTKDMPLRVKASAVGLAADEYRAQDIVPSGWTGMAELAGDRRAGRHVVPRRPDRLPTRPGNCRATPASNWSPPSSSALGRVTPGKQIRLVRGEREAFGLRGRSAEQRIALDLLMDDEVGIVSLGGRAGTGKSAMALCAGLER